MRCAVHTPSFRFAAGALCFSFENAVRFYKAPARRVGAPTTAPATSLSAVVAAGTENTANMLPETSCVKRAVSPPSVKDKSAAGNTGGTDRSLLVTSNRSTDGLVPVGKLLAARGVCSRGEGDDFFSLGLVLLDGRRLERNEAYVHPDAPVQLAPRAARLMQKKVTVLLHKPMHFLSCRTDKQMRGAGVKPLSRSLLCPENHWGPSESGQGLDLRRLEKLVVAGRLDADSSGLQVLTQDGRVAAQLLGGTEETVAKEYLVQVDEPPSDAALSLLESGLSLDGCELLRAQGLRGALAIGFAEIIATFAHVTVKAGPIKL